MSNDPAEEAARRARDEDMRRAIEESNRRVRDDYARQQALEQQRMMSEQRRAAQEYADRQAREQTEAALRRTREAIEAANRERDVRWTNVEISPGARIRAVIIISGSSSGRRTNARGDRPMTAAGRRSGSPRKISSG